MKKLTYVLLLVSLAVMPAALAQSDYMGSGQWVGYSTLAEYEAATGNTIDSYQGAPSLEGMGLPPVEERLPKDPMVIAPAEGIGSYGGTLRGAGGGITAEIWEFPFSYAADLGSAQPNIIKGYDVNEDATVYTFYLREGLRWSDGAPMTADDWVWYFDNILLNEEYWPEGRSEWQTESGNGSIAKIDDYTIQYSFQESYGLLPFVLSRVNPPFAARHYMQDFHPDFADPDELAAKLDESGLPDWTVLWEITEDYALNPDLPTIFKWKVVSDPASPAFIMERNPYYWKVDPAGNQLPYIDEFQMQRDLDSEVALVRSIAGEFDYSGAENYDVAANYALLKENESNGNYVIVPTIGIANTLGAITINYSVEDDTLRELFNSHDFRVALSIGADRDFINNILYNGLMIPSQWAPADGPPYHGERDIFKQYAVYDPDRANELLDGLGLTWNDDETLRLRPDGGPVEIVMFMNQGEECQDSVAFGELLKAQWEDTLGIQLVLRPRDADFWVFGEENVEQGVHLSCFPMNEAYPSTIGRSEIVVPLGGWPVHGEWGYWLNSGGEEGDEPPEPVKEIFRLGREFLGATDPASAIDLELRIAEIHAENIYVIGFLKQPKDYVLANLAVISSGLGNQYSPMPIDWNYVAMETWYFKDM